MRDTGAASAGMTCGDTELTCGDREGVIEAVGEMDAGALNAKGC